MVEFTLGQPHTITILDINRRDNDQSNSPLKKVCNYLIKNQISLKKIKAISDVKGIFSFAQ